MAKGKARQLRIGSISTGTLRMEDLIPSLLWDLKQIRLRREDRKRVRTIEREFRQVEQLQAEDADIPDELDPVEMWADLCELGDVYAPAYCYFGSTEGDGADIGVFPSMDALDDAVRNGEVWKTTADGTYGTGWSNNVKRWDKPGRPRGYVMDVSDHGNVTLYFNNKECWGVV